MSRYCLVSVLLLLPFVASADTDGPEPPLLDPTANPPIVLPVPPAPPTILPGPPHPIGPVEPVDPPAPLVKIRLRAPACAGPGADLKYCILVENCSPAEAHHVLVKNALPKNTKYLKAEPEPTIKDGELRWNIGTLGGGACREIVLWLRPLDLDDVKNCVRVQYEHGQCVCTRQLAAFPPGIDPGKIDPGKIDPKIKDKIPPPPDKDKPAKLKITVDGPAKQYQNLPARYFITVKNEGIGAAGNLLVTFELDKQAQFIKASDEGKHLEGQVAWLLGTLEVGESKTVAVEIKAKVAGELCHKVKARADGGITAETEKCTVFTGVSALLLEMFDRDDPIDVGADTSFPILVRNTGSAPVTNLRVKAIISDKLTLTRAKAPVDHRLGEKREASTELLFDPLPTLAPGAELNIEVFVKGTKVGDARFMVEIMADQLKEGGPVAEVEATQVFIENGRPLMSRRSRPTAYQPESPKR